LRTETIQPEDFNEKFTVFLDSEGCSVERALHEMTAVQVLASIEWHTDEALRLQEESAPYVEIANVAEAGMLDPSIRRGARQTANDTIRRTAVALEKAARLLALVTSTLPKQWEHMPLRERILRTWREVRDT
jgi:hypothetical protein